MCQLIQVSLLLIIFCCTAYADISLILTSNGPVIQGAEITFIAKLYNTNGEKPSGTFKYEWSDNGIPGHSHTTESSAAEDKLTLTYPSSHYPSGPYEMQVDVSQCYLQYICRHLTSRRLAFNITDKLNGNMNLLQNDQIRPSDFVSNKTSVNHEISLSPQDYLYLKNNATSILTYWFIDCNYYGMTSNFTFEYTYGEAESQHVVEALVVVDFEPITTPAPTTTTTTTTTTTPKPTTTTTTQKTTTTTQKATTLPSATTKNPKIKRHISDTRHFVSNTQNFDSHHHTISNLEQNIFPPHWDTQNNSIINRDNYGAKMFKSHVDTQKVVTTPSSNLILNSKQKRELTNIIAPTMITTNGSIIHLGENNSYPYVCLNQTNIAPDPKKAYGYFSRIMTVKAPVDKVGVIGNNWLPQGDMLSLAVKCSGSSSFDYCFNFMYGLYNITGNETCANDWEHSDKCEFNIMRYYNYPGENTIVLIVKNDVSKNITSVTVTVYKVTKHPQLSVIVVPVSFSIVAVILIVFGLAYYIQNRRRFTVEVADFDFGHTYTDMEYKTFRERLRDSITSALTRTPTSESQEPSIWPPSSRKYGSMT